MDVGAVLEPSHFRGGAGRATRAQKKGRSLMREPAPWNFYYLGGTSHQKKRTVLVAIFACSSSEQPAFVGTLAGTSVGLTRSLLKR
jgi:hypothetical protein